MYFLNFNNLAFARFAKSWVLDLDYRVTLRANAGCQYTHFFGFQSVVTGE